MSKAVLVMDMPEVCNFCKLRYGTRCMAEGSHRIERYSKPSWCPLRPLPERRNASALNNEFDWFDAGWNACLDAIEGRKDVSAKQIPNVAKKHIMDKFTEGN